MRKRGRRGPKRGQGSQASVEKGRGGTSDIYGVASDPNLTTLTPPNKIIGHVDELEMRAGGKDGGGCMLHALNLCVCVCVYVCMCVCVWCVRVCVCCCCCCCC